MTTGTIIIIATVALFFLIMSYLYIIKFTSIPEQVLFNRLNKKQSIRTTGKVIDVIKGFGRFNTRGRGHVGIDALVFMIEFKATDGKIYRNKYKTNLTSCYWLSAGEREIPVIYDEHNPKMMTIDRAYYQNKIKSSKEKERERKKAFNNLEN